MYVHFVRFATFAILLPKRFSFQIVVYYLNINYTNKKDIHIFYYKESVLDTVTLYVWFYVNIS